MAQAHEWLEWFVRQPQTWCEKCRAFNEDNPPSWWRGNCRHYRHLEKRP